MKGLFCNLCALICSWAGVTYLPCTVLTSSKKSETAVHCYDPALSVLVMMVSGDVFHVVSALQPIVRGFCILASLYLTLHIMTPVKELRVN